MWWFLPRIDMKQPWVYMCPTILNLLPISLSSPSLWVAPEHQLWVPCFRHWICTGLTSLLVCFHAIPTYKVLESIYSAGSVFSQSVRFQWTLPKLCAFTYTLNSPTEVLLKGSICTRNSMHINSSSIVVLKDCRIDLQYWKQTKITYFCL